MFIGHFGIALAARKHAKASLGTLFLAAQLIDLLWPILLMLGLEKVAITSGTPPLSFISYPISHSLLLVFAWAVLFGTAYLWRRHDATTALILGALVVSHWLLDLIVHVPDLPIVPGGVEVGLGLWQRPLLALSLELAIFLSGLSLYLRSTKAKDSRGVAGVWILVSLLILIQVGNAFGPPPPSVMMVALAGNLQWLLILLAYWVDRHRVVLS